MRHALRAKKKSTRFPRGALCALGALGEINHATSQSNTARGRARPRPATPLAASPAQAVKRSVTLSARPSSHPINKPAEMTGRASPRGALGALPADRPTPHHHTYKLAAAASDFPDGGVEPPRRQQTPRRRRRRAADETSASDARGRRRPPRRFRRRVPGTRRARHGCRPRRRVDGCAFGGGLFLQRGRLGRGVGAQVKKGPAKNSRP